MNKQNLNEALAFINAPQGELQIILYASLEGIAEPRKLDIREEDLSDFAICLYQVFRLPS